MHRSRIQHIHPNLPGVCYAPNKQAYPKRLIQLQPTSSAHKLMPSVIHAIEEFRRGRGEYCEM